MGNLDGLGYAGKTVVVTGGSSGMGEATSRTVLRKRRTRGPWPPRALTVILNVSAAAMITFFPEEENLAANFPMVVVLPTPLTPMTMMT